MALGYSFAKYVINTTSMHIQSAEEFYFNSSILTEENTKYVFADWDGKNSYILTIDLKNYEDELRCTTQDISYKVETRTDDNVTLTTSLNDGNQILVGRQNFEQKINLLIHPNITFQPGDAIEIEVIATTNAPYEKKLSATFEILVEEIIEYKTNLVDGINSEYADLYIENYENEKNIKIIYDNTKVILDTNNELLEQAPIIEGKNQNTVNVQLASNGNYHIIFIKKDTSQELVFGTDIIVTDN